MLATLLIVILAALVLPPFLFLIQSSLTIAGPVQDAVEHPAPGGIAVEAAMDEVADAAAGLRPAPGVGFFDRPEAGSIARITQEAHEIAHRRMAEPEHQRVAAGIDQLVDPTRLEASRNVDVRI